MKNKALILTAGAALTLGLGAATSADAATVFTVSDAVPNGENANGTRTLSTTLGTVSAPPAIPTTTYTVTGLDLTSVGGTANETIAFDIDYTQTGGTGVQFNSFGNVSVTGGSSNSQIDPGEALTATVSLNAGLTTFADTINLGLTNIVIGGRDFDEQFTITHQGGTINAPEETVKSYAFASSSFVTLATVDTDKTSDLGNLEGFTVQITAVPEPGSLALLGLGGLAVGARRRRG